MYYMYVYRRALVFGRLRLCWRQNFPRRRATWHESLMTDQTASSPPSFYFVRHPFLYPSLSLTRYIYTYIKHYYNLCRIRLFNLSLYPLHSPSTRRSARGANHRTHSTRISPRSDGAKTHTHIYGQV